ncbi:alpha-galactosidase [Propioniciclava coleopterorum]|uniref:Alpha-galactosidase n=1 Tax=Propioniciclava coleopterorum TaxID=2714937 RepID=A0A6G7YAG9_9ACTN|nr:glycoside hydrolase family 36 protein [Propioniciclava coleopterorum]QIK73641.1 alpha-galactosidase [Propioniciclava coleopterorum]
MIVDDLRLGPHARVYAEGWQSWSATGWSAASASGPAPQTEWQRLMRFRPDSPLSNTGRQGEGLLLVDPGDGSPVLRYAGATDEVPSIRTTPTEVPGGTTLRIDASGPVRRSEHADAAEALAGFADAVAAERDVRVRPAPRVWCSWYRYFEDVTAADIAENLAAIDAAGLEVEVIQIDDGWSPGLGEGARPDPGFGHLPGLVTAIRDSGRAAGLWLAPFLVGRDTTLARRHPDWLTGPAGYNWGQDLVGLDLTHPGVREHLADTVAWAVGLGISYLKLDFLYAGALPGPRHSGAAPLASYRDGLALIREAAGPDAYLVGCGAPLLPSVGLVDAMRVSPDTFHEGGQDGSAGLRGAPNVAARTWQDGRWWANDPDCLVMRPSFVLRDAWAEAITGRGTLRSFSDRVADLDAHGLAAVRRHLSPAP